MSDRGHVWGVDSNQNVFRRTGSSWEQVPGKAVRVRVTEAGVWARNVQNDILYRTGTYGDQDCSGTVVRVKLSEF